MPRRKGKAADGTYDSETRLEIAKQAAQRRGLADTQGGGLWAAGTGVVGVAAVVEFGRARSDGYLRIVFDEALTAWWKWRFTSGRWEGHYVLVSQSVAQGADTAFIALAEKLGAVDAGALKPSWDKGKRD